MTWTHDDYDGAQWHKSTYSGSDNGCVERAALRSGRQAVRDSKDRALGVMVFTPASWQTFLEAVRANAL